MATAKRTTIKTTEPKDTTPEPETVEVEEISPLDAEMENLPHIADNPPARMMLEQIAIKAVESDEYNAIIKENTPDAEGIKHVADTSDNEEVVTARKERDTAQENVNRLIKELEDARKNLGTTVDALNKKANEVLLANLDKPAKDAAIQKRDQNKKSVTTFMNSFKEFFPEWGQDENVKNYITDVNKRVYGGQPNRSVNSKNSVSKRGWSGRVREWAINNGKNVHEKGRIPEDVKAAYVEMNPGDPEPTD